MDILIAINIKYYEIKVVLFFITFSRLNNLNTNSIDMWLRKIHGIEYIQVNKIFKSHILINNSLYSFFFFVIR